MSPEPASPEPLDRSTPERPPRSFAVRPPGRSWAVRALFAANLGVFAWMILRSDTPLQSLLEPGLEEVLEFGADHGPYVARGEWWRLVSSAFVHIGVLHLLINMLALRALSLVEGFYGNGGLLLVYLASALGGAIASSLWNPAVVSAGASGALFGLAGALAAFFLVHRGAMPEELFRPVMRNLLFLLGMNVLFGLIVPGIDNAAHLGGLVTGHAAGRLLDRDLGREPVLDRRRVARVLGLFALLACLALLIPARAAGVGDVGPSLAQDEALRALREGQVQRGLELAERGLARSPDDVGLLAVRGLARAQADDARGALDDLDLVLEREPERVAERYTRAFLRWNQRDAEGALSDMNLLVERESGTTLLHQVRGEILIALQRWPEAASEFRATAHETLEGQLFLWIARSRMGETEDATRELRHSLDHPGFTGATEVDAAAGGLLAGHVRESELLAAYDRLDAGAVDRTRLYYFAGSHRLAYGDTVGAAAHFAQAVERGASAESTWLLARTELERLVPR